MAYQLVFVPSPETRELLTKYMSYVPAGFKFNRSQILDELLRGWLETELPKFEDGTYRKHT